jgi:hypothetical protein
MDAYKLETNEFQPMKIINVDFLDCRGISRRQCDEQLQPKKGRTDMMIWPSDRRAHAETNNYLHASQNTVEPTWVYVPTYDGKNVDEFKTLSDMKELLDRVFVQISRFVKMKRYTHMVIPLRRGTFWSGMGQDGKSILQITLLDDVNKYILDNLVSIAKTGKVLQNTNT